MHQADPNVEEIFYAALELESPGARSAFLDRACGNSELRRRVERLLAEDARGGDFLEVPASMPAVTVDHDSHPLVEGPGTVIGPYKLLEMIGEGGMGVVFMAEQTQPVRRKVALKVIKPGMDTKQVIARFEAERQALALMDHPNIAKVLEAGATESGRPYFVMELVRGVPITEYCDQHRLPIDDRLGLFVLVCQAVQHAHQKGIIHRDIKPSNVLITLHDGVPVPKVIDFGVAKAAGQSLTDKTLFTGFAQLVGTPLYMSPEQAELSGLDVDTRSDIYSLGVLLYELLTGTTPFDQDTLRRAALDEMRRIIREQEPPTPSHRLGTLGATQTTVSANRGTDPRRLDRSLRGELDWITMKALEKDRRRRYETAAAFAADILRYRNDEPVEAGPPSAWYRLRKSARRHRVALATTGLFTLALVAGAAVSLWQADAARRQAARALRAEAEAVTQRDRARKAVDEMYTRVAEEWLKQQPRLQPLQRDFLLKALAFYQEYANDAGRSGPERQAAADAYTRVSTIQWKLGERYESERARRRALAIREALVADFPEVAIYRSALAAANYDLSFVLGETGHLAEAERLARRGVELIEPLIREFPKDPRYRSVLATLDGGLAGIFEATNRRVEAEQAYRRSCQLYEALVAEVPGDRRLRDELAGMQLQLGIFLREKGRMAEAEHAIRRAAGLWEALVIEAPDVPQLRSDLTNCLTSLGRLLEVIDRPSEAARLHQRAVEIADALVVNFPRLVQYRERAAGSRLNLANALAQAGRLNDAEAASREALGRWEALATGAPDVTKYRSFVGAARNDRAGILMSLGRRIEARRLLEDAVADQRAALKTNPADPTYRRFLRNHYKKLFVLLLKMDDPASATRIGEDYVSDLPEPEAWHVLAFAFANVSALRNPQRAVALAARAVEAEPNNAQFWNTLGMARYRAGAWKEALAALEKALDLGPSASTAFFLAMAHRRLGHESEARHWLAQGITWMKGEPPGADEELRGYWAEAEALIHPASLMPNGPAAFVH